MELGLPTTADLTDLSAPGADPPELGVVVAFGRLIRPATLAVVPMINLHFSLLPRWRGAAPLERAILAGDRTTGVCVMAIEEGLDTGPVYARSELEIGPGEHLGALRDRLVEEGTRLLLEAVAGGVAGLPEPVPQVGEATYAAKLEPGELEIDWSAPSARVVATVRLDRAFTFVGGRRLRVLRSGPGPAHHQGGRAAPGTLESDLVATGDGTVRLETVQPEGGRPMSVQEWLQRGPPARAGSSWARTGDRLVGPRAVPPFRRRAAPTLRRPEVPVHAGRGRPNRGPRLRDRRAHRRAAPRAAGPETVGVDRSEAMLAEAARWTEEVPGLRFGARRPGPVEGSGIDLVFANASLHWVPDHPNLLARLRFSLAPGGQLAFQVPATFGHPSHVLAAEVAAEAEFAAEVSGTAVTATRRGRPQPGRATPRSSTRRAPSSRRRGCRCTGTSCRRSSRWSSGCGDRS